MSVVNNNPNDPINNLAIGKIIEVDGSHIIAELEPSLTELSRVYGGETYPIGQFGSIVRIHFGRRLIYAFVGRLRMKAEYQAERGVAPQASSDERIVEADLFGEGEWVKEKGEWQLEFSRGVATYPLPQQTIYLTPKTELRFIYGHQKGPVIEIGEHVGSGGSPCFADLNELFGKHTAVLGSTGSGKSGTVAAILHGVLEKGAVCKYENWSPRIIILDPHNEYKTAFSDTDCERYSTDEGTLNLPYWLLDLQETESLFIGKTEYAATSQANIIKNALIQSRGQGAEKLSIAKDDITVDSPVPYILGDPSGLDEFGKKGGVLYVDGFIGAINSQRPNNANKKDHEDFNKVIRKVETLIKDSRMNFLMRSWDGRADGFPDVLSQFIGSGKTIRIIDLSGVPSEVAGAASAAIARMLFSVKVWQTSDEREKNPILLVCEEAHRYVPDSGEAQYVAAQEAIRRLAKEGRKYGIGLMLVSQRPCEVESTVLSQCNSWLVHRITNEADRAHVTGVLPDSLAGLTKMLSGLRQREVIFVGLAATLPSRILIKYLPKEKRPNSHDIDFDNGWKSLPLEKKQIEDVIKRWRFQKREASGGQDSQQVVTEEI